MGIKGLLADEIKRFLKIMQDNDLTVRPEEILTLSEAAQIIEKLEEE